MDKTLHLVLKAKWFWMILNGSKKEEYREIKPYWSKRLISFPHFGGEQQKTINDRFCEAIDLYVMAMTEFYASYKQFDTITFRLGYAKNAPTIVVECKGIRIGEPLPEWSGNMQGDHFIISLGAILKTQNISNG